MERLSPFAITSFDNSDVKRYNSSYRHQQRICQRGSRRIAGSSHNSTLLRFLLPILILICILINSPEFVQAEYDVSEEQLARIPYRFASASFSHAGVIYSYGGATRNSSASTLFTSISFDPENGQVIYADVPQSNESPGAAYSQAVLLPDKNRMLLFGGCNYTSRVGAASTPSSSINDDNNNATTITETTDDSRSTLRLYEYRFDTQNWTALPIQTTGGKDSSSTTPLLPSNRKDFTATLSPINGKIYIYGGQDIYYQASANVQAGRGDIEESVSFVNDSWVYDPETNMFTQLPPVPSQPDSILYGHSAVALDNGIIVHLMGNGFYGTGFYDSSQNATMCDRALLLDTNTDTWSIQPLIGTSPQQIINGFAVLGPDRKHIYISGGFGASRTLQNISVSSNDLNALDTSTWTWVSLDQQTVGDPPKPRFYTCAELLHDAYMVVAFGVSEYFWYNDINVLRFYTSENGTLSAEWTANLGHPAQLADLGSSSNMSLSMEAKMAIAVGVLAAAVVIVAYISWYYRGSAKEMLGRSYRCLIWTSRAGEPMWTGLAHILSKTILACIFLAYLVYTIFQVANSSVATLTIQKPVQSVNVPDIRFCFDGWTNPSLGCQTETLSIDDCVSLDYISSLDMGIHQPYFGYTGTVDCYLFHPDKSFQLSGKPNAPFYNGSRIQFSFYGTALDVHTPGLIHITLYPPGMDPNLAYYFNKSQYGYDYDTSALDDWLYDESNNLVSENTYTVEANTSSAVSYQISTHQYLQESAWNNFGIWYAYNATPSIETQSLQGARSATPRPLNMTGNNFLDVYPSSYTAVSLLDQRIYTFLSSVGPCGGLLALLITLNSWIFGARPRSPWGIIHRILWTDRSRNSLLQGLREKFGGVATAGNIPFVNPVDKRFLTKQEADWHDIVLNSNNYRRRRWLKLRHHYHQQRKEDQKQQQAITTARDTERQKQKKNNSTLKLPYDHRQISEKPSFGTTVVAPPYRGNSNQQPQSTLDEAMQKIEQLQRRVQLTELLLKTYYIDDEVFRGLHIALAEEAQQQQQNGSNDSSSILSSSSTSRRHNPGTVTATTASAGTRTENGYNDDDVDNRCNQSLTPAPSEFNPIETPPVTPTTPPPAFNQHSSLFSTSTDSYASSSRDPPPPRFSAEVRASQLPPFYS